MSGIFGIWNRHGAPVDPADIESMARRVEHWGRDGTRTQLKGSVALGHVLQQETQFSSHEVQPWTDPRWPHLTIVADARIDNRDDVCRDLGFRNDGTLPDSALCLAAFERWGTDCGQYLQGAWCAVIFDERQQQLFCLQDHIAFRPLYYYQEPEGRFVFATDVTAILDLPDVPREVDPRAMTARWLLDHHWLKTRSYFRGINKLAAGHHLTVAADKHNLQRWWSPESVPQLRLLGIDEYAEAFREQLHNAVARCLSSGRLTGSHLSGGLDSSTITVVAARQLKAQGRSLAKAFSWSPPFDVVPARTDGTLPNNVDSRGTDTDDERDLIELICRQEGISCDYTTVTQAETDDYRARDVSIVPTETAMYEQLVCRTAAAQGIEVLLSGWGGDEFLAFNGRGYFAELASRGRWIRMLQEAIRKAQKQSGASWKCVLGTLRRDVLQVLLPDLWYRCRRRDIDPRALQLEERAGRSLDELLGSGATDMLRCGWHRTRQRSGVRRTQLMLLENGHLSARLESWAHLGAGHGVSYRYPLLDRNVIEFALSLPSHLFFHRGWKRFLFRYAVADFLPDHLRWKRTKHDPAMFAQARKTKAADAVSWPPEKPAAESRSSSAPPPETTVCRRAA